MAITITGVPAMLESKGRPYSTAHVTQLHALTGLRFIAALLVVLFHFEGTWRWDAFVLSPTPLIPITIRQALHNFSFNGFVGVNIFFILSGFVLAYNYLTPTNTLNGTRKAFWVARVARIYPVYLLGILFGAMPYAWNHAASAPPIVTGVSALTLVQAWQPYVGTAWNPPGWSLSAEIFFYMLFPFVAPWIARFREWFLYVLMIGCWCICLAVPLLYATLNPDHVRHPLDWNDGPWMWLVQFLPLIRLPEFVIGVALGRLFMIHHDKPPVMTRGRAIVMRMCVVLGLVGGAVLLALVAWPYALLHTGLLDPLFGLLIYSLAWGTGRVSAFLATPLAVVLGKASYALYIIHYSLWTWLAHSMWIPPANNPTCLIFLLVYLCLAIAVSLLILRLVEQPARRAIRSMLL